MTLQINLKQIKADGASNNHVLAWSNAANAWVSTNATSIITANGDVGASGQVLTTGGPGGSLYWANVATGSVISDTNIISPFLLMGA